MQTCQDAWPDPPPRETRLRRSAGRVFPARRVGAYVSIGPLFVVPGAVVCAEEVFPIQSGPRLAEVVLAIRIG